MSEPDEDGWQRLDGRMLLIGPLSSLRQFAIPVIVGLVGISSSQGEFPPVIATALVIGPVLLGFVPWLTTRYRITPTQFQQKRGLLNKEQLTAPLDRVRSVDLEASLLHRVLGVAKVQVGTGVDETRIELNALSTAQAEELRGFLLARGWAADVADCDQSATNPAPGLPIVTNRQHPEPPEPGQAPPAETQGTPARRTQSQPAAQVLATIDWSWLRYAPFSLSRLAIVAGAIGVLAQWGDSLPFLDAEHIDSAWQWLLALGVTLLVLAVSVTALVAWIALSVAGYVVQWWGLRLTREHGTIRLRAGLLTTRSTTVEEAKVRGVELVEPFLLRVVRGGELSTLATGVGSGGITTVLPPCPRGVCQDVGQVILDDAAPLRAPLVPHGPAARRRCHVRSQRATLVVAALAVAVTASLGWPWWPGTLVTAGFAVGAGLVAEAAYAHLGHLLSHGHLTAGSGALERRRTVLEHDGVIGWVVGQSYFQRRRGLATLTATTAAGNERVTVRDVPLAQAVALAAAVTPSMVEPFLAGA